MNDISDIPVLENSTADIVSSGDSVIQDGSATDDSSVSSTVPVLPSESVSNSIIEETTTEAVENSTEAMETTTDAFTDSMETPIPSISGNEVIDGGSSVIVPSLSGNNLIVTVSGNDIADLITSTISGNELEKDTLTEAQNMQYIALLEKQSNYLKSINSTMICLLFFTLLTWAIAIIKRITGGFAGYGHD